MTAAALRQRATKALPWSALTLALVPLLFLAIALRYCLGGPLPPGDGGLFYLIARQLLESFPRLPAYVSVSGMELPLAYPPLGFYLAAVLAQAGIPLDEAMRYLPLVAMTGAMVVACSLLRQLASSPTAAAIAAVLLLGLPRFWAGQLAGGGITRAPGLLFCLLAWLLAARAAGRWQHMALAGAAAGLALLFHPEMGLYAGAGILFLALLRAPQGNMRRAVLHTAGAGAVAVVVSSPWWVWGLWRQGPGLLLGTAAGSQGDATLRLLVPVLPPVYGEVSPWPVAVITLAGALAAACTRRPWPLVMAVWLILVDPRKGTVAAALPLALGAGEALATLVKDREQLGGAFVMALAVLSLSSGLTAWAAPSWPLEKLRTADVAAAAFLGQELQEGERVLVLSGVHWARDPWSDWGPVLSGREFLLTVQGSEWLGPQEFGARIERYQAAQQCASERDEDCLTRWLEELAPAAVWVTRTCRCPWAEEELRQEGAVEMREGVYLRSAHFQVEDDRRHLSQATPRTVVFLSISSHRDA
jgi:4-amino-4-deoxy-L-arabinose transferase-like glycosyltransferase